MNFTPVVPPKFVPVMTTVAPTPPLVGLNPEIVGAPTAGPPIVTSWSSGVEEEFVLERTARYWRYREEAPIVEPLLADWKAVQDASGNGVSPVRTDRAIEVPVGRALDHESRPHVRLWTASKMRESKLPEAANGLMRIQSTETDPPPTVRSLASGRMAVATVTRCEATAAPSTK